MQRHYNIPLALDCAPMVARYHIARRRLFLFDYDGTLTPIVTEPHAAIPSQEITNTLRRLVADSRNHVWIISGRDTRFLERWLGHISGLGLSAEHGCFIRRPGSEYWDNIVAGADTAWQNDVIEVFSSYTEHTEGSWIERKSISLTWHYRQADPNLGNRRAEECRNALEGKSSKHPNMEIISGKFVLEVRPKHVNKGSVATKLINEYENAKSGPPEFVLCLGDDQTDEDMFSALLKTHLPKDNIFTCTVGEGSKQTLASWYLLSPSDVLSSINKLNNTNSQ